MVAAAHVHTIKRHGPDRCVGFTPIPAMSMASYAAGTRFLSLIGGVDPLLLRLVRGPSALLAAGLRRPDRRAGVRRLVQRRLPDDLGDEPADDAHARRPLHDRGALPRPEGRRRLARLRRAHQVRRPLAGRRAGQRRGAGDGDGPRDPEGVLRRARRCPTSRTTRAGSPTCRCWSPCASATAPTSPTGCCGPPTSRAPAASPRTTSGSRSCSTRATGEPVVPNGSVGHRYGEPGQVEPAARRPRAGAERCSIAAASAVADRPAALRRRRDRGRLLGPSRRADDADRRSARDHGPRSDPRPLRRPAPRTCPASGRPTTTTRSPTRRPGRSRSRRSTASSSPASPASSPATPSRPRAAR